jgi:hypothetical protein
VHRSRQLTVRSTHCEPSFLELTQRTTVSFNFTITDAPPAPSPTHDNTEVDICAFETRMAEFGKVMVREFGVADNAGLRGFYPRLKHITYHPGLYTHQLLCHVAEFCRTHGPLIKYSSWVLESANKVWKILILHYTNCKSGDNQDIIRQALQRMLRMTNLVFRAASMAGFRSRGVYYCSQCLRVKRVGHTQECFGFPDPDYGDA